MGEAISDPLNRHGVAFLDSYPDADNWPALYRAWSNYPYFQSGTIIITSATEGLFMIKDRSQRIVP